MIAISGWLQLIYLRLPREVRTQLDDCGLAEVLAVSLDFLVSGSVVQWWKVSLEFSRRPLRDLFSFLHLRGLLAAGEWPGTAIGDVLVHLR